MKLIKYLLLSILWFGLSFCSPDEVEPDLIKIDEDCKIKWIANDFATKTLTYQGNLLIEVLLEQHLPQYADAVYTVNYYDNMIEIEKSSNSIVQAFLENGLMTKKIEGRIYDTDPPYATWLNEENYIYNDQGQLVKLISKYTIIEDSTTWEESYDFHWENGNISLVWFNGMVMEFTYDNQDNPFRGNIALALASEWSIPWAYFNTNNIISSKDWYGFEKDYIYTFNNSVYPTSVAETYDDLILVTTIGYECE